MYLKVLKKNGMWLKDRIENKCKIVIEEIKYASRMFPANLKRNEIIY